MIKTEIPLAQRTADALTSLRRTERGESCLRQFLQMVDNGGHSLDSHNWEALKTLAEYCEAGGAGNLLSATCNMRHQKGRYHG